MNADVETLRQQLQDLHDSHTTGFVDDVQYAQARVVLERRLVDAVMKAPPVHEVSTAAPLGAAPVLPPVPVGAAAGAGRRQRWGLWLGAAAVVHTLVFGAYWWSSRGEPLAPTGVRASHSPPPQATPAEPEPSGPAVVASPPPGVQPPAVAGATGISGTVSLAPELKGQVHANDAVFVYARAVDGPPMPLAVIRKQVRDLPLAFKLDDSMAMWPAAKVSAFARVVVTARVSKSGEGQARPGDLEGHSAAVAAGTSGLQIEIGSIVAP